MSSRLRRWPWLAVQIILANVGIVLTLGYAWYWLFIHQSSEYSDRLMSTFNIQPGALHTMYVAEVERHLWISILIGLCCAVVASIVLTLVIVRPLSSLARATNRLRQGDYSVRVKSGSGEVGVLADTMNELAEALAQEEGRRAQYLADLGHELRTPITSLRGYTEGLEDGIFKADANYFGLMSQELSHLTALTHSIEAMDLQSDELAALPKGVAVAGLLEEVVRRWDVHLQRRDLTLHTTVSEAVLPHQILISDRSLRHIIDNLMLNMVRHAEAGSPCSVSFDLKKPDQIEMVFSNGASALPETTLPYLFDRFYRASQSRTRAKQEHSSGLGLAIVRQHCLANGGTVEARLHDGRLSIVVQLPLG